MEFVPGLTLSKLFFNETVQPIMVTSFPNLVYSAARLDYGSDVLGFDTPMSMDHGWGPKLTLFLSETDFELCQIELSEYFAHRLPFEFHGFPTHFAEPLSDGGVMSRIEAYPIQHGITITTPARFFFDYLGLDLGSHGTHQAQISPAKWLTIPQQRLCTLRSGQVFYDGLGALTGLRIQLDWYPHDLWLYLMACQWQRISQIEPFVGRTGSVGDDIGTRLVANALVHDLMRLCFLIEKQYTPYIKWFGSAFQRLEIAAELTPVFKSILESARWQPTESHLSQAYLRLAKAHNDLEITPFIPPEITPFYNRPFLVPHSSRFVGALYEQIKDPDVRALPRHLGSIDQIINNTDVLESMPHCQLLARLYQDSPK